MERAISFVLFFSIITSAYSQNIVINPGFESWQKINKPTGWTTAISCQKDSAVICSGMYSCRQATTTESKELGQILSVTPGKFYRITFWYRSDPSGTGNGCRIWSNWKDADGNSLSDDISLPLLHSAYLKSDTWKLYTAEVTAPVNAAFFNLVLRSLPNSITFWDDIVFEESIATGNNEFYSEKIKIYPNPTSNYLIISNIHNIQQIDIQTVTGTKTWSANTSGEEILMIPVSGFKNGIYIIYLHGSGKKYIRKFIKTSS